MDGFDSVPIAALNHYAYCPHRCWRMFCIGDFVDNQYTIEGTSLHERVHTLSAENRGETYQVRSIWLKSEQYQLLGKADLIEETDGQFYPVEYKRGDKGEWENDAMQVCAQALCLEEMTQTTVSRGYVYYAASHQRQVVEIDAGLRERAIALISEIVQLFTTGKRPEAVYTPRCRGCSLYSQCLPQAKDKVRRYQEAVE